MLLLIPLLGPTSDKWEQEGDEIGYRNVSKNRIVNIDCSQTLTEAERVCWGMLQ